MNINEGLRKKESNDWYKDKNEYFIAFQYRAFSESKLHNTNELIINIKYTNKSTIIQIVIISNRFHCSESLHMSQIDIR
jgi:hypothetical protein